MNLNFKKIINITIDEYSKFKLKQPQKCQLIH